MLINGEEQKAGEEYKCLSFESTKTGQIRMSYASAYGLKNIGLDRNIELYSNENIITIEDVLSSDKYTLTENLITFIKPKIENERILLTGKKATLCIDVINGGNINTNEVYFSNHKGVEERVWQIQFNCESKHDNRRIELKLGFNKKI